MLTVAAACLSLNIYFEARNQSIKGMALVAEVTINRVRHPDWPSRVCEVVWQNKQFSWTHDGKSDEPKEKKSWDQAQVVANDVLNNGCKVCNGATYYHHYSIKPYWTAGLISLGRVDDHIFYK